MKKFLSLLYSLLIFAPVFANSFPVTVESCGEKITFNQAPQRAVSNDINITEIMLGLGLEDAMVGISGVSDRDDILPDFKTAYQQIPQLSKKYPSMENVLGADPDFMFAGWNYGFKEGGVTPKKLKSMGIDSYVLSESCIRIMDLDQVTMEDTYRDIINLGKIFGIEDKAQSLVKGYQQTIQEVQEKLKNKTKTVRVFVYDSGEDTPFTAGSFGIPNTMIRLAGGIISSKILIKTGLGLAGNKLLVETPR